MGQTFSRDRHTLLGINQVRSGNELVGNVRWYRTGPRAYVCQWKGISCEGNWNTFGVIHITARTKVWETNDIVFNLATIISKEFLLLLYCLSRFSKTVKNIFLKGLRIFQKIVF